MSIQPEGEALRRAVKWLSDERKRHPEKPFLSLFNDACMTFDLSPKEAETLSRYTKDNQTQ
ncbi:MAG: hypothetical protein V3S89_05340 [Desulfobacterales bacterium]